jgi:hypothetical protein
MCGFVNTLLVLRSSHTHTHTHTRINLQMAQKVSPNIRVNALAPGFFLADQNRALLTNEDGSLTSRGNTIVSNTPVRIQTLSLY